MPHDTTAPRRTQVRRRKIFVEPSESSFDDDGAANRSKGPCFSLCEVWVRVLAESRDVPTLRCVSTHEHRVRREVTEVTPLVRCRRGIVPIVENLGDALLGEGDLAPIRRRLRWSSVWTRRALGAVQPRFAGDWSMLRGSRRTSRKVRDPKEKKY